MATPSTLAAGGDRATYARHAMATLAILERLAAKHSLDAELHPELESAAEAFTTLAHAAGWTLEHVNAHLDRYGFRAEEQP